VRAIVEKGRGVCCHNIKKQVLLDAILEWNPRVDQLKNDYLCWFLDELSWSCIKSSGEITSYDSE